MSLERRFALHNRRIMSEVSRATSIPSMRAARGAGGSRKTEPDGIARGFSQLALAAKSQGEEAKRAARANKGLADSFKDIARAAEKAERAQIRAQAASRREFRGRVGSTLGAIGSSVASVGKTALAVTGLGGGALIASKLGPAAGLEQRQRQLIVNATGAGQTSPYQYGDLQKRISNEAVATGVSQEGITGGLEKFVQRTGDLGMAVDNMRTFATVSMATGASVEDIAGAAADLMQKFDIKKPEQMADALATLAYQGKKGAFELRDMADTFPELAAAASRAGMKGVTGMQTLGGLAQISRSATGSGAEASTALQMALAKMVQEGSKLESGEALGGKKVNVFTDKKKTALRNVPDVIADIISQSGGNLTQLQDVFDARGIRAMSPLIQKYTEVSGATKGTAVEKSAAGRAAVVAMIQDASSAAGTFADIQKDAGEVQKSTNVQLEKFNSMLTSAVQEKLLPTLTSLIPKLTPLIPTFGLLLEKIASIVQWASENPIQGVGAIILGKVAADVAGAGIGAGLKSVLTDVIVKMVGGQIAGAAVPGMAGAGGGGTPTGTLGKVAQYGKYVPVAGALGAAAGEFAGNTLGGSVDKYGGSYLNAIKAETDVSSGKLTQEQIGERKSALESQLAGLQGNQPGMLDKISYGLFGSESAGQARDKAIQELTTAIAKLNSAVDQNTSATSGTALNRGNSPSPVKG